MKEHFYAAAIYWNGGEKGTENYTAYSRNHTIQSAGKSPVPASSDPSFRGDKSRYNPEELLLASLSSCHLLWYLHLCAENGVVVLEYSDAATGIMQTDSSGGGRFTEVRLFPKVLVKDSAMIRKAYDLHHDANKFCFIANSCNFPVLHEAEITTRT